MSAVTNEPLAGGDFEVLVVLGQRAAVNPDNDGCARRGRRNVQVELVEVVGISGIREIRDVVDHLDRLINSRERQRGQQQQHAGIIAARLL